MSGAVFPAVKPTRAPQNGSGSAWISLNQFLRSLQLLPCPPSITPFPPAVTHLLKAPALPPSALLFCVVAALLCNCHLITAPKCWTSVHFLNYARLDLIARKYLAYFNCLQRFRKHFEEWLPHYWPLLWSTLQQKEQIDNLQTGNCVERTVSHLFRVSLIHHGFHQIIVLIAIPLFSLYDAPNTLSSDLHAFICYHNYPVTGVIFIM